MTLDSETELTLSVRKLTLFTFASSVTENNSMYLIPNMNYLFKEMNIHEEKKSHLNLLCFFIAGKNIYSLTMRFEPTRGKMKGIAVIDTNHCTTTLTHTFVVFLYSSSNIGTHIGTLIFITRDTLIHN